MVMVIDISEEVNNGGSCRTFGRDLGHIFRAVPSYRVSASQNDGPDVRVVVLILPSQQQLHYFTDSRLRVDERVYDSIEDTV